MPQKQVKKEKETIVIVESIQNGAILKTKCLMNTEKVADDVVNREFKILHAVYPSTPEHTLNEISWRLAYLNPVLQGKF